MRIELKEHDYYRLLFTYKKEEKEFLEEQNSLVRRKM